MPPHLPPNILQRDDGTFWEATKFLPDNSVDHTVWMKMQHRPELTELIETWREEERVREQQAYEAAWEERLRQRRTRCQIL